MNTPAAFSGDYVDLRFVKSRKVAQIIVELPIEQAAAFVASFGTPNPATSVPVALARLDPSAKEPTKEKRRFTDLPPATQAGVRCSEYDFQRFLGTTNEDDAARKVRLACRVESRSELNTNPKAAQAWKEIEGEYYSHQRGWE